MPLDKRLFLFFSKELPIVMHKDRYIYMVDEVTVLPPIAHNSIWRPDIPSFSKFNFHKDSISINEFTLLV